MSSVYLTEPPTQGKVLLQTSYGDIDVELWPKEAPVACRNFVQLCLEGYYSNMIFHRIIKGFMVQTGDPTGSGEGGESVFGRGFANELHGRIRFNHRGQVAMANSNKPNSNHSQFFITLDACDWLKGKHTIFGKVTGTTIFNVLRMGDVEVDGQDRPIEPPRLLKTEVLWNPFDDIVPRVVAQHIDAQKAENDRRAEAKRTRKAVNNIKLLSFGDEQEDVQLAFVKSRIVSSHDVALPGDRLVSEVAEEVQAVVDDPSDRSFNPNPTRPPNRSDTGDAEEPLTYAERLKAQVLNKRRRLDKKQAVEDVYSDSDESTDARTHTTAEAQRLKQMTEEYTRLRDEAKRSKRAVTLLAHREEAQESEATEMLSAFQQSREKYKQRKKSHGERESETLEKLDGFLSLLNKSKAEPASKDKDNSTNESYHGQVLEKADEDDDVGNNDDWFKGKFKFRKHIDDAFRSGALRKEDDYVTIDSRQTGKR